jgi:hypothetical protein
MHELLQTHYDGEDWKAVHNNLTKEFYNLFEEEREDLGDLPDECGRLMKSYVMRYKEEDKQYRVIDSELDEIVTLPNGLKLEIIIDLIVEDRRGGIWIWDHKFRKRFEATENIILDPQMTLYFWGVEQLGYTPLRGAVQNEVRTKAPTVPRLLKTGGLSRARNIDTDLYTYASAVRSAGFDLGDYAQTLRSIAVRSKDSFFRRTSIPKDPPVVRTMMRELNMTAQEIQKAEKTNRFPRTYDSSCRWQCEYKDLCIAELHGGDISSMIRSNFKVVRREDSIDKARATETAS